MVIILMYKFFLFYKPKGRRVKRFVEAESNTFVVFSPSLNHLMKRLRNVSYLSEKYANLRSRFTQIYAAFTAGFKRIFVHGTLMDQKFMPWKNIAAQDDEALKAIYAYLMAQPKVETPEK